ncbi:hypothetical protein [Salimicrobium salexigens]|nr:hypothetical protein [Salimicrobium salexigens]
MEKIYDKSIVKERRVAFHGHGLSFPNQAKRLIRGIFSSCCSRRSLRVF